AGRVLVVLADHVGRRLAGRQHEREGCEVAAIPVVAAQVLLMAVGSDRQAVQARLPHGREHPSLPPLVLLAREGRAREWDGCVGDRHVATSDQSDGWYPPCSSCRSSPCSAGQKTQTAVRSVLARILWWSFLSSAYMTPGRSE